MEEISDYLRPESPDRAEKFLEKIDKAVSRLAKFPLLGLVPKDARLQREGYRVLVVEDFLVI